MKFTKRKIKPNFEALKDVLQEYSPPGKLMFRVNENKDLFEEEKDKLDSFKEEMLKKHAVINEMTGSPQTRTDEDGNPTNEILFKSEEDEERYGEVMNEVYDDEVDIDVKTVQTSRVREVELPPTIVFQLRWMFD